MLSFGSEETNILANRSKRDIRFFAWFQRGEKDKASRKGLGSYVYMCVSVCEGREREEEDERERKREH